MDLLGSGMKSDLWYIYLLKCKCQKCLDLTRLSPQSLITKNEYNKVSQLQVFKKYLSWIIHILLAAVKKRLENIFRKQT